MKMTVWLILQLSVRELLSGLSLTIECFRDFLFSLVIKWTFSGSQEGHTSQHPNASVGLKRPTNGSEFELSLKHIPYNGDSRETINTADAC